MLQPVKDTYRFDLAQGQYLRIRRLGWLFFLALIVTAIVGVCCGAALWTTYVHKFTLYLKWQDALVALSWFISFISILGSVLVVRFLYALRAGRTAGMVTFEGNDTVTVRDLSAENMKSIFWIMNSAFWCFVTALVGLVPAILVGWTMHIPSPVLMVITTGLALILSLAGIVVSIVAVSFILIGCLGGISFCRKLGSSHTYRLNGQATIRIDNFVLTITYPGHPESLVDLNLLSTEDQRQLLSLLHTRWVDAKQVWNPTLGEEIEQALVASQRLVDVA
ncbi:hypothetical protein [Dictyobacter aurantiacus]|uniref:Uncharacterized protein n=1 Tax=Dictyobacter aurantiacus TaxID=1936993 RepID=A0A401ZCM4_9CHLR|nr:hypothetical protein [Dictyobacter aurantiacus]GCE04573.1 hypothetical protein KDAU_19020 [Dictyobacter aurantiacus]